MLVKKMRLLLFATTGSLIALLLILSIQHGNKTFADDNPVSISTTPHSILFDVNNMKPGDWAERQVTVQNRGNADFIYYIDVKKKSGSTKLFEGLSLKVEVENYVMFDGNLSDFNNVEARFLKSLHEEDISLTVSFPTNLGNEYQGLEVEAELLFIAQEKLVNEENSEDTQKLIAPEDLEHDPDENHILPKTASNNYNYLFIGVLILLIGFIQYRRKLKPNVNVDLS